MNYLDIIIPFAGGLGMFIYGMQIMAQGLENAAGNKMKSLLEVLTKNKLMGVMLGAAMTAVMCRLWFMRRESCILSCSISAMAGSRAMASVAVKMPGR